MAHALMAHTMPSRILHVAVLCAILCALGSFGATETRAQYAEAYNTPRAKLASGEVGVWVVYSQIGFTMIAAEKQQGGQWYALATTEPYTNVDVFEAAVAAAGGVDEWIASQLPLLNSGFEKRFRPVAEKKSDDKPLPLMDQVNATLKSSYKIVVGADGVPRLVKK